MNALTWPIMLLRLSTTLAFHLFFWALICCNPVSKAFFNGVLILLCSYANNIIQRDNAQFGGEGNTLSTPQCTMQQIQATQGTMFFTTPVAQLPMQSTDCYTRCHFFCYTDTKYHSHTYLIFCLETYDTNAHVVILVSVIIPQLLCFLCIWTINGYPSTCLVTSMILT